MTTFRLTKAELKQKAGRDFQDGDIVIVGKYQINIRQQSPWVFDANRQEVLSTCPRFIQDFLAR